MGYIGIAACIWPAWRGLKFNFDDFQFLTVSKMDFPKLRECPLDSLVTDMPNILIKEIGHHHDCVMSVEFHGVWSTRPKTNSAQY